MSAEITLPRLAGTRQAAESLVRDAAFEAGTTEVVLYARAVASAAQSFADELIRELGDRGVTKVRVVGSSQRLCTYLIDSAARRGGVEVVPTSSADLISH